MHLSEFDFDLPPELIAQSPVVPRDHCRLLVLDRQRHSTEHRRFDELPDLLRPSDILVVNDTRVRPARLYGHKPTGGRVEVLLTDQVAPDEWLALAHPGLKVGQTVRFASELIATVESFESGGQRRLRFNLSGESLDKVLHDVGVLPTPPYVRENPANPEDYQTVYSNIEGSVAAPTAGLHFTTRLLGTLRDRGIEIVSLTLHVGIGTFQPVKVDRVDEHEMHAERYQVDAGAAVQINAARAAGRRVVAVGTTVVRTLESVTDPAGQVHPGSGETSLFIVPGYTFRCVDALITNFHLPRSTLLLLVSALAGRDQIASAYREAIANRYRFYSFGDAMLIV